jgi:prepilin-type N-terminal cleavage/methylation domain-containing protein
MKTTMGLPGKLRLSCNLVGRRRAPGFTLIELVIVMIVVAIGVTLAVPTFRAIIEKRQLTTSVESIASFINFAQSAAVKRNEDVIVNIRRTDHDTWCVGATVGATACDCSETVTTDAAFCDIGDVPYRIAHADVISNPTYELMHQMSVNGTATANSSFIFDPIRGTLLNLEQINIRMHTNQGSDGTSDSRDYQLEVDVLPTGLVSVCTVDGASHAGDASYVKNLLQQHPTCSR